MKNEALVSGLFAVLQLAIILGFAALSGYFLLSYIRYGEEAVSNQIETEGTGDAEETEDLLAELPQWIRVRIMDNDFQNNFHREVTITSDGSFVVTARSTNGSELSVHHQKAGACARFTLDDIRERELLCVEAQENETLKVTSLNRTQGAPEYLGRLYLWREADGIALVNELPLEEYLYAVVSSEMPSYYPIEAQKAQAVCARTYAVNCIGSREDEALIDRDVSIQWDEQDTWWDLSDSVEYQVYNNVPSTKRSIQAVDETAGEVLSLDDIQYYSTSCGSEHRSDLGEEDAFVSFLNEEPEDGEEYDSRYLRWSGEIEKEKLTEKLMREYPKLQNELELTVERRRGDGQVQSLTVSGEAGSITIEGEYEIRKALGGMDTELTLMDGSCVTAGNLLPSAFFYLTEEADCWRISGGGYGHGNGMSQCGAAAMAEKGMDYQEIIGYYYSIRTTGKTE